MIKSKPSLVTNSNNIVNTSTPVVVTSWASLDNAIDTLLNITTPTKIGSYLSALFGNVTLLPITVNATATNITLTYQGTVNIATLAADILGNSTLFSGFPALTVTNPKIIIAEPLSNPPHLTIAFNNLSTNSLSSWLVQEINPLLPTTLNGVASQLASQLAKSNGVNLSISQQNVTIGYNGSINLAAILNNAAKAFGLPAIFTGTTPVFDVTNPALTILNPGTANAHVTLTATSLPASAFTNWLGTELTTYAPELKNSLTALAGLASAMNVMISQGSLQLTYPGSVDLSAVLDAAASELGITVNLPTFTVSNPMLSFSDVNKTPQIQLNILNANGSGLVTVFETILTNISGSSLPSFLSTPLNSLGTALSNLQLVVGNNLIEINDPTPLQLSLTINNLLGNSSVIPGFIQTDIQNTLATLLNSSSLNLSLQAAHFSLSTGNTLDLGATINGLTFDLKDNLTNPANVSLILSAPSLWLNQSIINLGFDNPLLDEFEIFKPTLTVNSSGFTVSGALNIAKNLTDWNIANPSTTPLVLDLLTFLGFNSATVSLGLSTTGLSFDGTIKTNIDLLAPLNLGAGSFDLIFQKISLAATVPTSLTPSFAVSGTLEMLNYDPTQKAPALFFTGGFSISPTLAATASFQLNAGSAWNNPFGAQGISITSLFVGLTIDPATTPEPIVGVSLGGSFGFSGIDLAIAMSLDFADPSQDAAVLSLPTGSIQLANLLTGPAQQFALTLLTKVFTAANVQFLSSDLSQAQTLLSKILDVNISAIQTTVNGQATTYPLIYAVPFATTIAGVAYQAGFGIDAAVTAWGIQGSLQLNADYTTSGFSVNGGLDLKPLVIDGLKNSANNPIIVISGAGGPTTDLKLNFNFNTSNPLAAKLSGSADIAVLGYILTNTSFAVSTSGINFSGLLNIPNLLQISLNLSTQNDGTSGVTSNGSSITLLNKYTLGSLAFAIGTNGISASGSVNLPDFSAFNINLIIGQQNNFSFASTSTLQLFGITLGNTSIIGNNGGLTISGNFSLPDLGSLSVNAIFDTHGNVKFLGKEHLSLFNLSPSHFGLDAQLSGSNNSGLQLNGHLLTPIFNIVISGMLNKAAYFFAGSGSVTVFGLSAGQVTAFLNSAGTANFKTTSVGDLLTLSGNITSSGIQLLGHIQLGNVLDIKVGTTISGTGSIGSESISVILFGNTLLYSNQTLNNFSLKDINISGQLKIANVLAMGITLDSASGVIAASGKLTLFNNYTLASVAMSISALDFTANGMISIPGFDSFNLTTTIDQTGNLSFSGNENLSLYGYTFSTTSISGGTSGLSLNGVLNLGIMTLSLSGTVNSSVNQFAGFSMSGSGSMFGYNLANANITAHTSHGVSFSANAANGISYIAGDINNNGNSIFLAFNFGAINNIYLLSGSLTELNGSVSNASLNVLNEGAISASNIKINSSGLSFNETLSASIGGLSESFAAGVALNSGGLTLNGSDSFQFSYSFDYPTFLGDIHYTINTGLSGYLSLAIDNNFTASINISGLSLYGINVGNISFSINGFSSLDSILNNIYNNLVNTVLNNITSVITNLDAPYHPPILSSHQLTTTDSISNLSTNTSLTNNMASDTASHNTAATDSNWVTDWSSNLVTVSTTTDDQPTNPVWNKLIVSDSLNNPEQIAASGALRIVSDQVANGISFSVSDFLANAHNSGDNAAGRVQFFNAAHQLVESDEFYANSSIGNQQVNFSVTKGFSEAVFTVGTNNNQGEFVYAALSNANDTGIAVNPVHGQSSEYLLNDVTFNYSALQVVGIPELHPVI